MHYKRRAHKSRRMAVFFDIPHTLGRKGDEDNVTAVRVGTNGVITMVI